MTLGRYLKSGTYLNSRGLSVSSLFNGVSFFYDKSEEPEKNIVSSWLIQDLVITILTVDIDDQVTVGQISASLTGTNLEITNFARVRYGSTILSMNNYTSGITPTFNVPDLATFLSSGMPLGTVSFEILRAV